MKKYIFMAIVAIAATINVHAEQGDISAGAQFVYASKHSMAGLGAQVQYEPITNLRFAPEFIYFFKNDGMSALNLNFNVHYVIPTSNSFAIYPLVGFTYGHYKEDVTKIARGSLVVTADGVTLRENLDYTVDYTMGTVTITNQSIIDSGSQITVSYPKKVTYDRCGANVGMGAQYRIKKNLHFFTEERFQIMKNFNQSVTVLGLKYTF